MPGACILLVPPSVGTEPGKGPGGARDAFGGMLGRPREELLAALGPSLEAAGRARAEQLLGARGELLEHAHGVMKQLSEGGAPTMAAWRRYTGVVWSQLDPASLSESQRRRIWVPSAVYGLTTATDAIADHRLSFRARLDGIGSLSAFWRPVLTDLVARRARGRTVIDLLPGEHASALDLEALGERLELIRVRFLQPDGRGAAGHAAKAVKGRVARQIATQGVDALRGFRWEGWRVRVGAGAIEVIAPELPPGPPRGRR